MISARNQLKGKVQAIKLDGVMAEIVIETPAGEVVAIISRTSAENMNIRIGDSVSAIIKATEVMVAKDQPA